MFSNYYEVRDWLESFIPLVYGKEVLGLARIKYLLKLLSNPEKKFKSIHVAGTSGKGSTCWYIAQLLGKNNLKVGLHISPHLVDIRERMQVFSSLVIPAKAGIQSKILNQVENDDSLMSIKRFLKLFNEIKPVVEKIQKEKPELTPSYFEILVAAAFKYFAQEKVDWAVVEVGLGGRLDATNVLIPKVAVITNIGLDHTDILGHTIKKIAFEKAGIIKKDVPVVTGVSGKAFEVIADVAKERQAPLVTIDTQNGEFGLSDKPYLASRFLAIEAVNLALGREISALDLDDFERLKSLPGRIEQIDENVILDGAHNPDKVRFLIDTLRAKREVSAMRSSHSVRTINKFILVVGFKKGKDWKSMVDLLVKNLSVKEIIATRYQAVTDTGRGSAVKPEEIRDYVAKVYSLQSTAYSNSQEAVFEALQRTGVKLKHPEGVSVIVTGSLYLVGEVRTMWKLPEF